MKRIVKQYESPGFRDVILTGTQAFTENAGAETHIINLYPEVTYQTVLGFGGAFTESAAYVYQKLTGTEKERLLRALFSDEGLAYNFCRTPIGSCDFALDRYVYVKDGDMSLDSFSVDRDRQFILPFIRDAYRYAGRKLMLFASPWSAPAWMKTNGSAVGGGRIRPECRGVWAEYICRYIRAFADEGVTVSAVSVQNEPKARQSWESCEFSAGEEGVFIRDFLHPALVKNGLSDVKILIWDHNKERVYDRAADTFRVPGVRELVWGIGFHWYSGHHFDGVGIAGKMFPEKMLIETEYCKVLDGRYEAFGADADPLAYGVEMLYNFQNGMHASVDWNMLLNCDGGPYHDRDSGCRAAVMADTETGTFSFTEIYANLYHFAHFIRRGAVRIGTTGYDKALGVVGFCNPDGTLVAVAVNENPWDMAAVLRIGETVAPVTIRARSLTTLVIEEQV